MKSLTAMLLGHAGVDRVRSRRPRFPRGERPRTVRTLAKETLVTVTGGDSVSGNATGRRQYKPVVFTAEVDASASQAPVDALSGQ